MDPDQELSRNNTVEMSDRIQAYPSPVSGLIVCSILLGALIVSASVLYASQTINRHIDTVATQYSDVLSKQSAQVANNNQAPAQNAAAPQAPTVPVIVSPRDNAPVMGSNDAKVTIVEFSDFQCPFCQSFFKSTLPELKSKYIDTGKVKLVYRYFPLSFHVNAQISAMAAQCADDQGKFWQYHDLLFTNGQADGTNLASNDLKKYAGQLGLNKVAFNNCLDTKATLPIVTADQKAGTDAGVTGTPTFYINGTQMVGAQPFASFQTAIDAALKE